MATSFNKPFRFLDLPPELRNMVYGNLNVVTRHHTIEQYGMNTIHPRPTVTLVYKSLPVSIFATCWQVGSEAYSQLKPKLEYLANEPMRLIVQGAALPFMLEVMTTKLIRYHEEQTGCLEGLPGNNSYSEEDLAMKINDSVPHISFNEMVALGRFIVKFTHYKRTRFPKSTVLAVTPYSAGNDPYLPFDAAHDLYVEAGSTIPGPVALMPHGNASEEDQRRFYDMGYHLLPGGLLDRKLAFIEDVGEIQWKEHWEETGDTQ